MSKSILFYVLIYSMLSCASSGKKEAQIPPQDCYKERKIKEVIANQLGTIQFIAEQYLLVTEDQRYLPCDIPNLLKVEGKKVIFEGVVLEVYPNERWVGLPFHLKSIKGE